MRPCLTLHTKAALEFKHREQVPAFFFLGKIWPKGNENSESEAF
jgi:hypothetical protein